MIGQITLTLQGGPRVLKRAMSRIIRDSLEVAAIYWYDKFLAKHFRREGFQRYHYKPRTKKYVKRKMRKYGHADPLVFTGESRQRAQQFIDLRPVARRVTHVLHLPKHFYQYHVGSGAPDKVAELTRLLPREVRACAKKSAAHMSTEISKVSDQEVIRI